ncbi:class D beta-lactamase [Alkaliphilus serpentinus]|nr:class D beta-lactamase [Alkaliphilus serpentinus]
MRVKTFLVIFLVLALGGCNSNTVTNNYIEDKKLDATIIVSSLKTGEEFIINKERSNQRYLPASAFKIPNTLIVLQEEIIKDENDIIRWDGIDKGLFEWNQDQSLKTALPSSCVWFYQELAKKVGIEKYSEYLNKISYGNKKVGARVDSFWLEGDIRISAKEQIDFLKKVYHKEYDFDEDNYQILNDLMIEEKNAEYILRGKTGWAQRVDPQIGWYVGYIETDKDTWFFACNLDIRQNSDAGYRKELVFKYLRELKIIKEL